MAAVDLPGGRAMPGEELNLKFLIGDSESCIGRFADREKKMG